MHSQRSLAQDWQGKSPALVLRNSFELPGQRCAAFVDLKGIYVHQICFALQASHARSRRGRDILETRDSTPMLSIPDGKSPQKITALDM